VLIKSAETTPGVWAGTADTFCGDMRHNVSRTAAQADNANWEDYQTQTEPVYTWHKTSFTAISCEIYQSQRFLPRTASICLNNQGDQNTVVSTYWHRDEVTARANMGLTGNTHHGKEWASTIGNVAIRKWLV